MISDLDETIRQLLIKKGDLDPSEIDISFEIPNREWSAGVSKPTINCYLFDIRENLDFKEMGWTVESKGTNSATRRMPLLRYYLTYLITAWTRSVEDEHRLLWHVLRVLARFPTLPASDLQGDLRMIAESTQIYTNIARPDGVLKSPGEFWTAMENQIKPSLSYVVTLPLERDAVPAGPPVLTSRVRLRMPDTEPEDLLWIAGTVRDRAGAPVPGATVEIEGSAKRAIADADGRFRISGVAAGRYTLIARADGLIQRREIEIPAGIYDVSLDAESADRAG
ncbi:MAG: hypothetical protein KatS3mg057_2098 [Herpetosiphonaceae bacterium]|nr:MAG: hypothetical protein KatS3mg057_2098 [Herpetosiphonaceae bacterium]